jgi:hypothetical protein
MRGLCGAASVEPGRFPVAYDAFSLGEGPAFFVDRVLQRRHLVGCRHFCCCVSVIRFKQVKRLTGLAPIRAPTVQGANIQLGCRKRPGSGSVNLGCRSGLRTNRQICEPAATIYFDSQITIPMSRFRS